MDRVRRLATMNLNDDARMTQPETSYEAVALRAYGLWEKRGCPFGSPEEDWLRAEEEIRREKVQPAASSESLAVRVGTASA
jgi:Protein of unknown function (DUF2934)